MKQRTVSEESLAKLQAEQVGLESQLAEVNEQIGEFQEKKQDISVRISRRRLQPVLVAQSFHFIG